MFFKTVIFENTYTYPITQKQINMANIKLIPYRGIANDTKVVVSGHVFKTHRVKQLKIYHKHFSNLRNALRRYQLSPFKNQPVEVVFDGRKKVVSTDKRGFFKCEFHEHNLPVGWHKYRVSFNGDEEKGEILNPSQDATAVISDIDDTVLISHSTDFLRKMNLVLFRNARTRKITPMVKDWTLHFKDFNQKINPKEFFYVSNSEWNLYDMVRDFFDINQLPKGVFFLQTLRKGLRDLLRTGRINTGHKMDTIRFLFEFYPDKPFILVGDNGQKDIEIYSKMCDHYPDRVRGVMIRKLSSVKEQYRIDNLSLKLAEYNIPLVTYH